MSAVISERKRVKAVSFNPIKGIRDYLDRTRHSKLLQDQFFQRNDPKVIKPFLKGLNAQYVLIDQLLIVCNSGTIEHYLNDLGFVPAASQFASVKWQSVPTSEHLPQGTNRLYHKEYNIEIYLQNEKSWNVVITADTIVAGLAKKGKDGSLLIDSLKTRTFLSIYDSLQTLVNNSKG